MIFAGFFWRQIFFGSPGLWLISNVTFKNLSFAPSFKLIGALHGGLPKKKKDCAEEDKSEDCSPGWSVAKAVKRWMPPGCASWTLRLLTALAPDPPGLQSSVLSGTASVAQSLAGSLRGLLRGLTPQA